MIKLAILSLLVLGCVNAAPVTPVPNPVCAMIAFDAPHAKCEIASDAHLVKLEIDSGVKYCWPSYDQHGYSCATFSLSRAETAQVAVEQERARAKQEADAKIEADKAKPGAPPSPRAPESKPAKPDPKKP